MKVTCESNNAMDALVELLNRRKEQFHGFFKDIFMPKDSTTTSNRGNIGNSVSSAASAKALQTEGREMSGGFMEDMLGNVFRNCDRATKNTQTPSIEGYEFNDINIKVKYDDITQIGIIDIELDPETDFPAPAYGSPVFRDPKRPKACSKEPRINQEANYRNQMLKGNPITKTNQASKNDCGWNYCTTHFYSQKDGKVQSCYIKDIPEGCEIITQWYNRMGLLDEQRKVIPRTDPSFKSIFDKPFRRF